MLKQMFFLSLIITFSINAITLKNGEQASRKRIDEVWQAIQTLNDPKQRPFPTEAKYY